MNAYHNAVQLRNVTPQTMAVPNRVDQVKNNAGGFVFKLDPLATMQRFLILGSAGGTYYASQSDHTLENIGVLDKVLNSEDGVQAVAMIAEISNSGRAAKQSPALVALAAAFNSSHVDVRKKAASVLQTVVRTQSHMFEFVSYVDGMRGWGRLLREAVAAWYNDMDTDRLGYQMVKYRTRNGWFTRDVLRMAHPTPKDPKANALFKWAVGKLDDRDDKLLLPLVVRSHMAAMALPESDRTDTYCSQMITQKGLTREMVPNTWLDSPAVWEALLEKMPMTAMVRNLGKMGQVGLLKDNFSTAAHVICERLADSEYLRRSRMHPFNILQALVTYRSGHGFRGNLSWPVASHVIDALDGAFYASFQNIEPSNKNTMLALDVSGSMGASLMNSNISCYAGAAAMAMATAAVEKNHMFFAFSAPSQALGGYYGIGGRFGGGTPGFTPLNISPRQRLDDVVGVMRRVPMGGTDCALPMLYATSNKLEIETFVVYTDNETWAGNVHPFQALKQYRQSSGIDARLVVVGMTSTGFSIADPSDPGMLDVVGFDSAAPRIIGDFSARKI